MNISLSKFAKDNGLHKSAVYRRCQELRIATSEGLTSEDVQRLEHEFSTEIAQYRVSMQAPTESVSSTIVEVENHRLMLAAPQLPQQYTLEPLRTREAVSFEDPLAIASQFLQAADGLEAAMQSDIQARQQRLKQTQSAKDAIAQKRQKLELEARLYQLQTAQLDESLTEETAELQAQLAELQKLGKPECKPSPQSA